MIITYTSTDNEFFDTKAITLQKILQVLNGGGSGPGGGTQLVFQARAPAAPDDPTLPAVDYPNGGGTLSQWDVGSGTWV